MYTCSAADHSSYFNTGLFCLILEVIIYYSIQIFWLKSDLLRSYDMCEPRNTGDGFEGELQQSRFLDS